MPFSHRDLRAHREVDRLLAVVAAALGGLLLLAVLSPLPVVGALAVLALAGIGGFAVVRGNVLVRRYQTDLRATPRDATDRLGALGVEVRSSVPLLAVPTSPARRSPHARPPSRRRSAPELPGSRPEPAI